MGDFKIKRVLKTKYKMYSEKLKLHARQKLWRPSNLKTISFDVTSKCNMRCPHCYAETFANVEPIGLDVLKKALDELYELGVSHYILQGGEAITDPGRLEAIINMIYPDETYINISSNGWDMDYDKIRWLKGLKVDKISFSLDSGIEEEHDANRLPGSFRRTLEAIDNVIKEGLDVSFQTTINHDSLKSDGFKKAYEFAKKKRIRMEAQIAEPVGKWDGRKDLLITPKDAKFIKELCLNSPPTRDGREMVKRDLYRGNEDYCPAGKEFMAIASNGEFLPCNFLQFSLGNIKDESIKEMRDTLLTNKWFNKKYRHCLVGENEDFINSYVMPYVGKQKPLNANKIFKLENQNEKRI